MTDREPSARAFLDTAYQSLGYVDGLLLDAVEAPDAAPAVAAHWVDAGDWLKLAARMAAEKVFFVGTDPVLLFRELPQPDDRQAIRDVYRETWCMGGPRCLFLAFPSELHVYALTESPTRSSLQKQSLQPLEVVRRVGDVATRLRKFTRENVESGRLFADSRFGDSAALVDRRLLADLRVVRRTLIERGDLQPKYAHALITRSILIRYLEDRHVINHGYFEVVARRREEWLLLLNQEADRTELGPTAIHRRYDRVLLDKAFTYALFNQLASNFNGDVFAYDPDEETEVQAHHLSDLRSLLLGDVDPSQPQLFFWAYDFKIVPISLISSIYEEFYQSVDSEDDNTHYTPMPLVDHVLSQVLTRECLEQRPRILDPACGSGVFLVEAFRRMVRYETVWHGQVASARLREMLREQITGIELNAGAVQVAAFSLYLALLNYQEPPEILASPPLPHLVYAGLEDAEHYSVLIRANSFSLTAVERLELGRMLAAPGNRIGRAEIKRLLAHEDTLPVDTAAFDVVIGNPPWQEAGESRGAGPRAKEVSAAGRQALSWVRVYGLPVGEGSYSQLFIHRSLSFVKPTGKVGLLVNAKVIWNERSTSREFRRHWLDHCRLKELVNFSHARHVFFNRAVAPFVFVHFDRVANDEATSYFVYASARVTKAGKQLRNVVFSSMDRRLVLQDHVRNNDNLWKTYWWGSHHDAALIGRLEMEERLSAILSPHDPQPAYGFQRGGQRREAGRKPDGVLAILPELRSRHMVWYGPLRNEWLTDPPKQVKRQPDVRLYEGQRLVLSSGIQAAWGPSVRLETLPFSFRHTLFCVPLHSLPDWQAELILGTLWSSLGRYWLFMTSGSWGGWYDKVTAQDILNIPVRFPGPSASAVRRILDTVRAIRAWDPVMEDLLGESHPREVPPPPSVLTDLNDAVFDMFQLSPIERDLIRDFFQYSFDLLTNGYESEALMPLQSGSGISSGTLDDLERHSVKWPELADYLHVFLDFWNRELAPEGEFRWRVVNSLDESLLAVLFETQERGLREQPVTTSGEEQAWTIAIQRIAEVTRQPIGERVYIDGVVRALSATSITMMKRNERRQWSRSAAREDAEAALAQAVQLPGRLI